MSKVNRAFNALPLGNAEETQGFRKTIIKNCDDSLT